MIFNPIIPVAVMAVICVALLFLRRKGLWNYIRHIIIVVLLFALNLRPMVPTDRVVVVTSNIDVLFVIDNTISMLAEDYGPADDRRIDAVKENVDEIMASFEGARFSVISFDDTSRVLVPYTYETELVTQAVGAFEGQASNYAEGTSLNIAFDAMKLSLKTTEKQEEDENITETTSDRIQIVFFISDGEITNKEKLRSFTALAEYIDAGAVLGYGTKQGGYMKAKPSTLDDYTEYVEYYDNNWNLVKAVSKIDEGNLEDIAEDLGITYFHVVKSSDIKNVVADVKAEVESEEFTKAEMSGEGYMECYFIVAIALGAFIIYDFIYYRNKMSKEG